jgi:hypothetical protein
MIALRSIVRLLALTSAVALVVGARAIIHHGFSWGMAGLVACGCYGALCFGSACASQLLGVHDAKMYANAARYGSLPKMGENRYPSSKYGDLPSMVDEIFTDSLYEEGFVRLDSILGREARAAWEAQAEDAYAHPHKFSDLDD